MSPTSSSRGLARASERVSYSPSEQRILALLPEGGDRIDTKFLLTKLYGAEHPFNARQSIVGTISSLIKKVEINREDFAVRKTDMRGPIPMSIWKEKRRGARKGRGK